MELEIILESCFVDMNSNPHKLLISSSLSRRELSHDPLNRTMIVNSENIPIPLGLHP